MCLNKTLFCARLICVDVNSQSHKEEMDSCYSSTHCHIVFLICEGLLRTCDGNKEINVTCCHIHDTILSVREQKKQEDQLKEKN